MAIASAFGFSGWDPIGSFGESSLAMHNSRRMMRYAYKMSSKYALNSPSWNVQGLRNAGLNPILAASRGSFGDALQPNTPNGDLSHSGASVDSSLLTRKNENRLLEAQASTARKQGDAAMVQAEAAKSNAETNQWTLYDARAEGSAGFRVSVVGADAGVKVIQSIRVNKVTGETYDALTGKRVRVIEEIPSNSARRAPDGEVTVRYEGFAPSPKTRTERRFDKPYRHMLNAF